jgi:hypothetical protein
MNIHPLRPRDHEDAARVAISWLTERHRKGWRNAFEALLDLWRPEGPRDGWQLDEDGMTMVSINAGEWLIWMSSTSRSARWNSTSHGPDGSDFITPSSRPQALPVHRQ